MAGLMIGVRIPWRWLGWGAAAALLLTPAVAMQFTREIVWGPVDFAVAAAMIGSVGLGAELAVRKGGLVYRAGAGLALLAAFLVTWSNLAVGIIGDPGNAWNLMFWGVLAIGLGGGLLARFRPTGMSLAMAATGAAQALTAVAAFLIGETLPGAILIGFTAIWLASAWTFSKAAQAARA